MIFYALSTGGKRKVSNKKKSHPVSQQREMTLARQQISVAAQYHSGPIPDPSTLERYDKILPGAAERILRMAEEQSAHRRDIEKYVIKSKSRDSLLGIIAGFLIAMGTIASGTYVASHGHVWSGTILGSAGLVGLVGVFIYGTRSSRKEREGKQ
jgi:uncharacterized membrane protein